MNIAIIGLGLIGGAMARAAKAAGYTVYGYDINTKTNKTAKKDGVIDYILVDGAFLGDCDIVILALYPDSEIEYISANAEKFKKGCIITDCAGVKRKICNVVNPIARENDFIFIGGHPMAGVEKSGYEFSNLVNFSNATMLLTPDDIHNDSIKKLETLFYSFGFKNVKTTTPLEHDEIIAYTSQLAHVLSSAYIKSPVSKKHHGFSAGSFKDMTRVASLNPVMWTELFMENSDNLVFEIDALCERLSEYSKAIKQCNKEKLFSLLEEGRRQKTEAEND